MKTYFTSDTHFGHANIIKYCARPFYNTNEMNREIIARWNSVVKPEDNVIHLGDFAFKTDDWQGLYRKLNGAHKTLVRGNHDKNPKRMLSVGFNVVVEEMEFDGWHLQHRPADTDKRMLCGHIHEKWKRIRDIINVGVDVWGFRPVTLEQLVAAEKTDPKHECPRCGVAVNWIDSKGRDGNHALGCGSRP